ncbi:HEPN domain-containing protein [Archaeoglobus sp.]|uniref:HEPN domain-containing protein n=1 Tax=Archaeoglobus sp. TaxID=1872626 RepID=UPI0009D73C1B
MLYPQLEEIYEIAVELEKHWLRTRYPIDYSKGVWNPLDAYKKDDAERYFRLAERFVKELEKFLEEEFGV